MDTIIYTAMNGARQTMMMQASNNHNLANLNTTGFRADLDTFKAAPLYGPGHPTRVYAQDVRAGVDFSNGQIMQTGRDLDVAITGDGFIAVQGKDGEESLTRRGDFHITPAGLLENGAGLPVMGNGGPIAIPPHEKLSIGNDGTISIQPVGQPANSLAVLDRIKLVNPDPAALKKTEAGLFRRIDGEETIPDATVSVEPGSIESSNVNAVEALVTMIDLSRQFEMHINVLKKAEETDQAAASVMKIG